MHPIENSMATVLLHHYRFSDFLYKIGIFGTVLGIFGVVFVRALLAVSVSHVLCSLFGFPTHVLCS